MVAMIVGDNQWRISTAVLELESAGRLIVRQPVRPPKRCILENEFASDMMLLVD